MQQSGGRNHRVELATTVAFALGPLRVVPAAREVEREGVSEVLEPRVMQVLVALAQASGEVVGRDELIARCWDGRIVVDNAINRVISRLRRLSETLAKDCFRIDTVARVGYRLIAIPSTEAGVATGAAGPIAAAVASPAPEPPPDPDPEATVGSTAAAAPVSRLVISRRSVILGSAAVGLLAAASALWLLRRERPRQLLAEELLRKGTEAIQANQWHDLEQAVAYLEQATQIDPRLSAAWAALSVAHRMLADTSLQLQSDHAGRARAAAQRALAIEPDNADAQFVLAVPGPVFGHWAKVERTCRKLLKEHPGHPLSARTLARLLLDTGRNREAAAIAGEQLRGTPFDTRLHFLVIRGRWGGGDPGGAEEALQRALELWPRHPVLWAARSELLAYQGRPAQAIELLEDPQTRPVGQVMLPLDVHATVLRALVAGTPGSVDEAISALLAVRAPPNNIAFAGAVYAWLAMLGAVEPALAVAEDHLLGDRTPSGTGSAVARETSRSTWWLFQPPVARLHRYPRLAALTRRIGLDEYWRATGSRHDLSG